MGGAPSPAVVGVKEQQALEQREEHSICIAFVLAHCTMNFVICQSLDGGGWAALTLSLLQQWLLYGSLHLDEAMGRSHRSLGVGSLAGVGQSMLYLMEVNLPRQTSDQGRGAKWARTTWIRMGQMKASGPWEAGGGCDTGHVCDFTM